MTASVAEREYQPHLLVFATERDATRVSQAIAEILGDITLAQTQICYNDGQAWVTPTGAIRRSERTPRTYDPSVGIKTAAGLIMSRGVYNPQVPMDQKSFETGLYESAMGNNPPVPQASLIPSQMLDSHSYQTYARTRGLGEIDQVVPELPGVAPNVILSICTAENGGIDFTEEGEAAFATWLLMAARRLCA